MKYFNDLNNTEIVKKTYRKLAMKFHPDRKGGNSTIFVEINNEYENAMKIALCNELNNAKTDNEKQNINKKATDFMSNDFFRKIIDKLINIEGLDIEICGDFIWISGNTYKNKELFIKLGGKWSKAKTKWYFAPSWWNPIKRNRSYNMKDIRNKYGSEKIKTNNIAFIEG